MASTVARRRCRRCLSRACEHLRPQRRRNKKFHTVLMLHPRRRRLHDPSRLSARTRNRGRARVRFMLWRGLDGLYPSCVVVCVCSLGRRLQRSRLPLARRARRPLSRPRRRRTPCSPRVLATSAWAVPSGCVWLACLAGRVVLADVPTACVPSPSTHIVAPLRAPAAQYTFVCY